MLIYKSPLAGDYNAGMEYPDTDFIAPFCAEQPEIVYGDNTLLVVEKPAGLLSVPGRHPLNRDCLITRLQHS